MVASRLLLVSSGLGALPDFVGQPEQTTLAFIPTAADPYDDRWFVENDSERLRSLGITLREVDIAGQTRAALTGVLMGVDGFYVAGGNTFYLLDQARKSGFDSVVRDLVARGVPYIGASAGAVLAGPDIAPVAVFDDRAVAPDLASTQGLGFVPFIPQPHYNDDHADAYKGIIDAYSGRYDCVTFTDEQAIVVTGSSYQIIAS